MPKDHNQLSVDRSTLTTNHGSHRTFIANGYKSAAVFGLEVREFNTEGHTCFSDPVANSNAHAYADF